jgi:hypothetical protein
MARKKAVSAAVDTQEMDEDAEVLAVAQDLATETLTGDVRDFILDRLRHEQDRLPWHERSEAEQRDTVYRVETAVHDIVRRAVEIIGAGGRRTISATLEQVTVKDGISGKIVLSKFDEQRHALMDATGSRILIVVADPEEFTGERSSVAIRPDQSELLEQSGVVHAAPDGAETPFH